jgi:hypothetical protein
VLEIGTGWVHWEATVAALFYDVDAVVVDVCDNRQLAAWRAYVRDLVAHLDALTPDATRADRARRRIERLRDARTWSEVYALLRLTYDPHPSGTLGRLHGREFDLVVSSNVLQHVRREVLDELPGDIAALLAPGGHALHRVDLADQLAHFDPRAPRKNYLRFSARAWRWIDSPLQHVNRLQLSEWLELFEGAGLERVEVSVATTDLGGLRPHREFARFPRAELECLDARLLHRRGCETGYDPPPALGGSGAAVGGAKRVSRIAT